MQIYDAKITYEPVSVSLMRVFGHGSNPTLVSESDTRVVVRFTDVDGQRRTVVFEGANLDIDFENKTFDGHLNSIKVQNKNTGTPSKTVILPTMTAVSDINDAVDSKSGTPTVKKSLVLDYVLQPMGSPFPDLEYTGSKHANVTKGYSGNDLFNTGGGNDMVYSSGGNDVYNAGSGNDTFDASVSAKKVDIDLNKVVNTIGTKTIHLRNVENVVGTNKNDDLKGNAKGNKLEGRNGADDIKGRAGRDDLKGGNGKDTIDGGDGKDTIEGGKGNDVLRGGKNDKDRDTFKFNDKKGSNNGVDRIKDWEEDIDRIHIQGGKASEVSVKINNGNTIIDYDEGRIIIEGEQLMKSEIDIQYYGP